MGSLKDCRVGVQAGRICGVFGLKSLAVKTGAPGKVRAEVCAAKDCVRG